ncbi:MAG: acetyltransferase [Legionella sp.]|nr:acetyltransferase [Legionella sp.]
MHTDFLKIVGCGGHSRVVLDAISLSSHKYHVSLCDSNKDLLGQEFCGLFIDSTMDSLIDFIGYAHVAIGNNPVRRTVFKLINDNTSLLSIIHPSALIAKSAVVEEGSFIAARAVLAPDCYIGKGCIVNHGAVIDHEVRVGAFSHIAPNSTLGGNVVIGEGVLVGAGAVILPGIQVGDGAIIGAGAVVIHDVKENTQVMGVPAVCKE